jgi:hypothetical protein
MTNPLTLPEIVSWFRSKQHVLKGSGVALVDIRERTAHLPAAAADFDCGDTMGRINGWVSGDFDFEVVGPDGQNVFWGHVHASAVNDLEPTYLDFLNHLQVPNVPGDRPE